MAQKLGHPTGDDGGGAQAQSGMVLLRHTLADGSWHYDWMLERTGVSAEHRLLTIRLTSHPFLPSEPGRLAGEWLADHRAAYLGYEGPISDGRGRVDRVARGVVYGIEALDARLTGGRPEATTHGRVVLRIAWEGGPSQVWVLLPAVGGREAGACTLERQAGAEQAT